MVTRSILFILLLTMAMGCKKQNITTSSSVKDSISTREVERIVEVSIPGDTVTITDYIDCDSVTNKPKPKKIQAHTGRAFTSFEVKADGTVKSSGGCDSLKAKITALDKELFHYRHELTMKEKEIYKTRWIDKVCRWFTGIMSVLIIGWIVLKVQSII